MDSLKEKAVAAAIQFVEARNNKDVSIEEFIKLVQSIFQFYTTEKIQ